MALDIEREGKQYVAIETVLGWKMRWIDENTCGVSPIMAFRETLYMLENIGSIAPNDVAVLLKRLKAMYNGKTFRMELVGFFNRPSVELEALYDGTEPPALIHSIFTSIQENKATS